MWLPWASSSATLLKAHRIQMTTIPHWLLLSILFQLSVAAQEANLNRWERDFVKLTTGARDDVQYNLYRNEEEKDFIYVELINRRCCDVKVIFELHASALAIDGKPLTLTAYISAQGVWSNGDQPRFPCSAWNPTLSIRSVTDGFLEQSEEIETDSTGKVTVRHAVRFVTKAERP